MKKKIWLILIGVVVLLGAGFFLYNKKVNKPEGPYTVPGVTETPGVKPVVTTTSELTPDLIKLTNRDYKDNFLISPYSIKVALNMLSEGASENTLTEIKNVLGNSLVKNIDNPNIKIANALFISNSVKDIVEKSFINTIKTKYSGEVLYDDFRTPKVINDWVNEHTDKMIPKILDSFDTDFVAGLANALAIDVKWLYEFECPSTREAAFTQRDNTKIDVEMMHHSYQTSDVGYIDNEKIEGIILPYREDTNLEFIGILPKTDIDSYLNSLTMKDLSNIGSDKINAGEDLHIELSMPRFKYDFDLDKFKDDLVEIGIKDAFNGLRANFYKIISKENMIKNNIDNIYVSTAIHKTAIDLNEKGTKAAAVTYFGLDKATAIMPKEFKTVKINLNRTFIYMIREKTTNEILFFGVVNTPNAWNGSTCESNN